MAESFLTNVPEQEPPSERHLQTVRLIGAGIGLVLIVFALCLALSLYNRISGWVENPAEFQQYLDKWEPVVRGSSPLIDFESVSISYAVSLDSKGESGTGTTIPRTIPHQSAR